MTEGVEDIAMTRDHVCVECRWCELKVDLESGSCYFCAKKGEPQAPGAVIHKPACRDYADPVPAEHWGA